MIAIGGVSKKQLTLFTRQLSTLQDAGLPLLRSLQILESQQKPGLMKNVVGLDANQLQEVFAEWNTTEELDSFLIEITAKILAKKDDQTTEGYVVDHILDKTGMKGTGKCSSFCTNLFLSLACACCGISKLLGLLLLLF